GRSMSHSAAPDNELTRAFCPAATPPTASDVVLGLSAVSSSAGTSAPRANKGKAPRDAGASAYYCPSHTCIAGSSCRSVAAERHRMHTQHSLPRQFLEEDRCPRQ